MRLLINRIASAPLALRVALVLVFLGAIGPALFDPGNKGAYVLRGLVVVYLGYGILCRRRSAAYVLCFLLLLGVAFTAYFAFVDPPRMGTSALLPVLWIAVLLSTVLYIALSPTVRAHMTPGSGNGGTEPR